MSDSATHGERRDAILSAHDIEAIGKAFDVRVAGIFESIGYDVSTADSRAKIYADHAWVRDFRTGAGKVKLAILTMAGGGAAGAIAHLVWEAITSKASHG